MENMNYKNNADDWAPTSPGMLSIDNQKRIEIKKDCKTRSLAVGYKYKVSALQLYQKTDEKVPINSRHGSLENRYQSEFKDKYDKSSIKHSGSV